MQIFLRETGGQPTFQSTEPELGDD